MLKKKNADSQTFPYIKNFSEWYVDLHGKKDSAISYEKYLRKIYSAISAERDSLTISGEEITYQQIIDNLEYLFSKNKESEKFVYKFINRLINLLDSWREQKRVKDKDARDWISGLRKYRYFLISEKQELKNKNVKKSKGFPTITKKIILNATSSLINVDEVYTRDDLLLIFKSRFRSQDRKNGRYAHELPMKCLVKDMPGFQSWISNFLENNVKFLVEDSGNHPMLLKDVESLTITSSGKLLLQTRAKSRLPLYSVTYSGKIKRFEDLYKNKANPEISQLALDHDTPIFQILKDLGNCVPNLDNYNENLKNKGKHIWCPKKLFEEFKKIHEKVAFTVMDQTENIKKGDDIPELTVKDAIDFIKKDEGSNNLLELIGWDIKNFNVDLFPNNYSISKCKISKKEVNLCIEPTPTKEPRLTVGKLLSDLSAEDKAKKLKITTISDNKKYEIRLIKKSRIGDKCFIAFEF